MVEISDENLREPVYLRFECADGKSFILSENDAKQLKSELKLKKVM